MDEATPNTLAREAIALEQLFSLNGHTGSQTGPDLLIAPGTIAVVISAPHATNHPRNGILKLADTYTGPLALQLATQLHAYAIVYARRTTEDPNYDETGRYKQELSRLVKACGAQLILDIHGMARTRPVEVALGAGLGQTLDTTRLARFERALREHGIASILVDDATMFNAAHPNTITSYSWRTLRVPALQVEIRKEYRNPVDAPENYERIILALKYAVEQALSPP